jgi:hypothetical protein
MFTRKDALELLAATFPVETIRQKDYINGGYRDVVWTPEKILERQFIELHDPSFEGLKEGGAGIDAEKEKFFRASVEHKYKNKHGLWP